MSLISGTPSRAKSRISPDRRIDRGDPMVSRRRKNKKVDEVLSILSKLKGVKHSFYLTKAMRTGLRRIERNYPSLGPLTIKNKGIAECLKRTYVACVIKDRHFRAPPHSTVYLIDENGKIIGRELLPG